MKWKELKGFEDNFEINTAGEIKNLKTGNTTSPNLYKDTMYRTAWYYKGKRYKTDTHKLLADNFIPNPENLPITIFKDNNKKNISLDNIQWSQYLKTFKLGDLEKVYEDLQVIKDLGVINYETYSIRKILCKCVCGEVKEYPYTQLNTGERTHCGCKKEVIPIQDREIIPLDIEEVNSKWREKGSKYILLEEISAERNIKGEITRTVELKCKDCSSVEERKYNSIDYKACWNCWLKSENLSEHPAYGRLGGMIGRCHNPNNHEYHNYGARGIKVCEEWRTNSQAFLDWCDENGFDRSLEIDREDNDKGYTPDNCRFVDRATNGQNTRVNKLDWDKVKEIRESDLTNSELSREYDVSLKTIKDVKAYQSWKE